MNDILQFLWIDDDRYRKKISKRFDDEQIDCKFENVSDQDLIKFLMDDVFLRKQPDLILIDHRLHEVKLKDVKSDVKFSGASYAEIIREYWPECPIVTVTAADLDKDVTSKQKESYDEVFSGHQIRNKKSTLVAIARSNIKIKCKKPCNSSSLLELLNPPDDDFNRLEAVLPDSITDNYGKPELTFELSKWIRKTLFTKPGFLLDSLWISTLIGVKENSFNKIEKYFKDAIYNGIYANDDKIRWWQSKIKEILFSKFTDSEEYLPWKLGISFDEIDDDDLSKCYVCKEKYPETVAYTDDEMGKRVQVHLKCSKPFIKIQKQLYYEEIRLIKEL